MTDKTDGVLAAIDAEILICRARSVAPMMSIRDRVAELLAADEEYDAAVAASNTCGNITYKEAMILFPRVEAALTRRAAAIRAIRGDV